MQTGNFQLVREINRRLIFGLIREGAEISRARLVQLTDLSKATVSAVVDELIAHGFVEEGEAAVGAVGRRPILLRVNRGGPCLGAVQVGPSRILGVLADIQGQCLVRVERICPVAEGRSAIRAIADVLAEIKTAAERARRAILGVGVSVPGILNPPGDVVLSAPVMGWRDVSLRRMLETTTGLPVWLGDEAKMAALAEATAGAGRGAETLLYFRLGPTVGAGLVRRGRLIGGTYAGHLTIVPDGPACWCGNHGCLDSLVGEEGLRRRALELGANPAALSLTDWLLAEPAAGSEAARRVLTEAGHWLGIAAADLIGLYQPELVVVGGRLGASHLLLAAVREEVRCRVPAAVAGPVRIVPADLGEEAIMAGAAAAALEGALGSSDMLDLS